MIIDFSLTPIIKELGALEGAAFTDVVLNSSAKTLDFYDIDGELIKQFDATALIVDGMIDSVTLSGSILTITFNTDAGKQDITIDLTEFINPELYWTSAQTKTYVDSADTIIYASGVSYADGAIAEAIAAESARCESTYLKEHQSLDAYYTSAQTEEAITSKGYITSAYTGFEELSGDVQTLSAATTGISSDLNTLSGATVAAISTIPANPVQSTSVTTLWKGTQAEYDALAPDYDANTFYIIVPSA